MRLYIVAFFDFSTYARDHDWFSDESRFVGRRDKLVDRFRRRPKDFTWDEMARLLEGLGYREVPTGRTGGSRRRFVHATASTITLHKPHPGNIIRMYAMENVAQTLTEGGLL